MAPSPPLALWSSNGQRAPTRSKRLHGVALTSLPPLIARRIAPFSALVPLHLLWFVSFCARPHCHWSGRRHCQPILSIMMALQPNFLLTKLAISLHFWRTFVYLEIKQ